MSECLCVVSFFPIVTPTILVRFSRNMIYVPIRKKLCNRFRNFDVIFGDFFFNFSLHLAYSSAARPTGLLQLIIAPYNVQCRNKIIYCMLKAYNKLL